MGIRVRFRYVRDGRHIGHYVCGRQLGQNMFQAPGLGICWL